MTRPDYTPPTFTDVPQSQWGSPPAGAVALDAAHLNALAQAVGNSGRPIAVDVRDYGAKGNGTTDDTAALQAAINAIAGASGGLLVLPAGNYKITGTLVMPFATGWTIAGASRGSTTITQATANTPILKIGANLTHSWQIQGLTFTWATQAATTHTSSVAILLSTGTTGDNIFNWTVHDCTFMNGFRGISVSATNVALSWGVHIRDCTNHGTMRGALYYSRGASAGCPNITIENCYIDGTGATEPSVSITQSDSVTLKNVEFNLGTYTSAYSQMDLQTCTMVNLITCRTEAPTVSSGTILWRLSQCQVTALGCVATGVLGAGNATFMVADAAGSLNVLGMQIDASFSSGTLLPFRADALHFAASLRTTGTASTDIRGNFGEIPLPTVNADKMSMNAFKFRGDENVTMTTGDYRIQAYTSPLTANRVIHLPSTGLVDGLEYTILRRADATGAFTLTVQDDNSGQNRTLSVPGSVTYRCTGGGWTPISVSTF